MIRLTIGFGVVGITLGLVGVWAGALLQPEQPTRPNPVRIVLIAGETLPILPAAAGAVEVVGGHDPSPHTTHHPARRNPSS